MPKVTVRRHDGDAGPVEGSDPIPVVGELSWFKLQSQFGNMGGRHTWEVKNICEIFDPKLNMLHLTRQHEGLGAGLGESTPAATICGCVRVVGS